MRSSMVLSELSSTMMGNGTCLHEVHSALKHLGGARLVPCVTYLVEIIYPDNKIVIPYDLEKLVLLGAYDETGEEIFDANPGFEIAPKYTFNSLEEIQELCKTLPGDKEGFVIRFQDGTRIKFKGTKYCTNAYLVVLHIESGKLFANVRR